MAGFDCNEAEKSPYAKFIGKPGHYGAGGVSATGILTEVNMRDGYLTVQPSLVGFGESGVRLEGKLPTVIMFGSGNPVFMRPLKDGDLEIILEERTKDAKAKKC